MGEWKLPPDGGHMDRDTGLYFQNMTGKQVSERLKENDILLIPVGSTENHGAAAPYGEDTFLVTRMAEMVAQKTGCTIAQPIWYGSHPAMHLGMPGTVVVHEDVFVAYLRNVIAGFWNAGFRKQIFLNGHGQEYVIPTALHQFMKKYQVPSVLMMLNWPTVIPQYLKDKECGGPFETPFRHADEAETSYSMALFPELVKLEDAVDNNPSSSIPRGHIDMGGDVYQYPFPGHCVIGFGGLEVISFPEGVIGKPSLASAEKAKPGLEVLLDYMVEVIDMVKEKYPPGKLPPAESITQRPHEEVEALLKGPLHRGGRNIYTVAYPP
ncbi:MAG TPA: creatininase family protein [Firmicutes bacterium]|nr:creatininase family protein [Bacillota bacterium]